MREKKNYKIITFHTTTEAMAMEKYCATHAIAGRLIPLPREISAGCGLAWKILAEDFSLFEKELAKMNYENIAELELYGMRGE